MLVFKPVKSRRTFEEAIEQITDDIMVGDLRVGDRLPGERALAAQMQISRPTLREAIRVLTDAEVLEVKRGGGMSVASDYVPRDVVRRRSELRVSEVAGVLECRRLIEPRVVELAAVHASDDDFERLEKIIDEQRRLVASGHVLAHEDRFLQLDTQFHLRIARATGNTTIVSLMRTLLRRLEIARDLAVHQPPIPEWVIDIHERTLQAMRSADHDLIERVMDEHLAAMERNWEQATGRVLVRGMPEFLRPVAERGQGRGGGEAAAT